MFRDKEMRNAGERESEEGGQRYKLPMIREVSAQDGMNRANTAIQHI